MLVDVGAGVGDGVLVGIGVLVGDGVGVGEGVGVDVGVLVGVEVGIAVAVGVLVGVEVGIAVAVGVLVGVAVAIGGGVLVGVGVLVVGEGVAVGTTAATNADEDAGVSTGRALSPQPCTHARSASAPSAKNHRFVMPPTLIRLPSRSPRADIAPTRWRVPICPVT